jgi:hypothetical protein
VNSDNLAVRIAASLLGLCHEFEGWWIHRSGSGRWIHRSESGRWLAIRGTICIRAHNPTELRDQFRQHIAATTEGIDGEST